MIISSYLVYSTWLAKQFNHIHYFDSIVGIIFAQKLYETVALMWHCDSVLRHMDIHYKHTGLNWKIFLSHTSRFKFIKQHYLRYIVVWKIMYRDIDHGRKLESLLRRKRTRKLDICSWNVSLKHSDCKYLTFSPENRFLIKIRCFKRTHQQVQPAEKAPTVLPLWLGHQGCPHIWWHL